MTAQQRDALDIEQVVVEVAPDAEIWWGAAERDFAASKGCTQATKVNRANSEVGGDASRPSKAPDCDYDAIIESAEAKAYLESRATGALRQSLVQTVESAFAGSSLAKLSVSIKTVHIVSSGQALIFGGHHFLHADFEVIDLASGEKLARYEELIVTAGYGPGGLLSIAFEAASSDPYDRLSLAYAEAVRNWLREES